MKVLKVFLFSFLNLGSLFAQVGGDNTYEFLNLTTSARISALGNVLVNSYDNDVNLAQQIPSLNHAGMNHQLALNFTNYYAGIKFGSLIYGIPSSRFENISVGMKYLNYGDLTRADEFGNIIGTFSAGEYAFYASTTVYKRASFRFGTALKAVYSNMEAYNSYGLLGDFSATYEFNQDDSSNNSHPIVIGTAVASSPYTTGIQYYGSTSANTLTPVTQSDYANSTNFNSYATRRVRLRITQNTPALYYYCSVHGASYGGSIAYGGATGLATKTVDQVTISNATTGTVALSVTPTSEAYTDMYVSGVYQNKSVYSLSGSTITLDSSAYFPNGSIVEVVSTT